MIQGSYVTMFITFILSIILGTVQCDESLQTISVNVSASCEPNETPCALGCCPFAQAVCCIDGFECCPHGKTCIPIVGICVGAVNDNGKISLESEKTTPLRSSLLKCPAGTTECAPDKCCRYQDAVCCSDGEHCCPNGYRCDLARKKCIPSTSNIFGTDFYSHIDFEKTARKMSAKSAYKSCPGGSRMCPNYMSCCINDQGSWGCCPNPSLPEIRYGGGECCDTIFGPMCCPDDFPTCTVFGCTK